MAPSFSGEFALGAAELGLLAGAYFLGFALLQLPLGSALDAWGPRLRHVHITDGSGSLKDEHLLPGEGDQEAFELLNRLAMRGFDGHVVLEVNTRKAGSRARREEILAQCLSDIRTQLGQVDG